MTNAYIIETAGSTAGIVLVEDRGVRFYASQRSFYPLDGQVFASVQATQRALSKLSQPERRSNQRDNRYQPAA